MVFFKVNATMVMNKLENVVVATNFEQLLGNSNLFSATVSSIGFIVLTTIIYWLFFVPCNWTKRLDDVSFELAMQNERKVNSLRKRDAINRIRRLRRIGASELPPPYPNGWYSILESAELKRGEAKSVSCLGENFVVYRTLENRVFVLDAYCPHMGANMGIGGRVVGNNIECPFHQWSFRGSDGKCVNVPYSSCVPQGSKVKKWISCEVHDNIFVWYHVDDHVTPWKLPVVTEIENQEFVYHGRNEFYINCHIQEIPENGADLAHFTAIHNASVFAGGEDPRSSALANAGQHHWQAVWRPDNNHKHLASVVLKHSLELSPKFHVFNMNVTGQQVGPSYVQLHMNSPTLGRIEVLQTVTPIEPLIQKVVHRFYAPRILAPFMKFVVLGESIMFERDIAMWNHKVYRSRPQLVKEDSAIKLFRNWYMQFYSENSKTFAEARDKMAW